MTRHNDNSNHAAAGIGAIVLAILGGIARQADDVGRVLIRSADDFGRAGFSQVDDFGRHTISSSDDVVRFSPELELDAAFRSSEPISNEVARRVLLETAKRADSITELFDENDADSEK